jgi:uncharacterized membrane protein YeaQ/YmgE (transglycosylase-associated protein family)
MDLLQVLILLSIAGICGGLAELILGQRVTGGNLIVTVVLGVIGSCFGTWLISLFNLRLLVIEVGTTQMDLIGSLIGSLVVLAVLSLLREGRSWRRILRGVPR